MKSAFLLFVLATVQLSRGLYVDEPLLYDTFPEGFMWAAATSAYQIEGGWDADGKGLSIWDVFTAGGVPGDGSTGQRACNSYQFYQKDVEALKLLGVSHYRFSISWARILPKGTGQVNQAGVQYYRNLINALIEANIQPMVTLYHWDLPYALEQQGGWLNSQVATWFEEYARVCFTELGDLVKLWITLNEPMCQAEFGYGTGGNAPGKIGSGTNTYIVGHNQILAHAKAYRLYESSFKARQGGRVGITLNINWYEGKGGTTANNEAAERAMQFLGGWFANPIFGTGDYPSTMKLKIADKSFHQGYNKSRLPEFTEAEKTLVHGSADFFGLNYYFGVIAENKPVDYSVVGYGADQDVEETFDPTFYTSSTGWPTTPYGMRKTLNWIKARFNNPEIFIFENGFADFSGNLDDLQRIHYYKHNINNVLKAIKDGVRVGGYADNLEWGSGFTQKFGLFSIDFSTTDLNRTAKASAHYYSQIVRDNGFSENQPCNSY